MFSSPCLRTLVFFFFDPTCKPPGYFRGRKQTAGSGRVHGIVTDAVYCNTRAISCDPRSEPRPSARWQVQLSRQTEHRASSAVQFRTSDFADVRYGRASDGGVRRQQLGDSSVSSADSAAAASMAARGIDGVARQQSWRAPPTPGRYSNVDSCRR